MDQWWGWLGDNGIALAGLGALSLITFFGTLVVIPILVARIPTDYFANRIRHPSKLHRLHPAGYLTLVVAKNLLGMTLVLAGIAMLVLPGQGLLTILIGLSLTDFPGKFAAERWLVSQPGVFKAVNWMRHKAGKEPLLHPD